MLFGFALLVAEGVPRIAASADRLVGMEFKGLYQLNGLS